MSGLKVLVVDDNQSLCELYTILLTAWGYDVQAVKDGQEALDYLSQHALGIKLVMTDFRMPGMNGVELTSRIKKLWPKIPVIVMSADDADEIGRAARTAGADAFMHKPFKFSELRTNIVTLCKGQ